MHLKSITLKGFKSFPDRTRLDFGPGVSVVVGPNGSGKSNVTDAVLWAMGEQSPIAVRGQTMQDIIFGGGRGIQARRVRQELPKVCVVRALQLVLDHHIVAVDRVPAQDVRPERADVRLLGLDLKLDADRFAQQRHVLRLRQPWCEVRGFTEPRVAQVHALETSEPGLGRIDHNAASTTRSASATRNSPEMSLGNSVSRKATRVRVWCSLNSTRSSSEDTLSSYAATTARGDERRCSHPREPARR